MNTDILNIPGNMSAENKGLLYQLFSEEGFLCYQNQTSLLSKFEFQE